MRDNRRNELYETPYGWLSRRLARIILSESQNHRCCYCGEFTVERDRGNGDPRRCTVEHILPRSRGGTNEWANIVAACASCNSARGSEGEIHAVAWFYKRLAEARVVSEAPPPARRRNGHIVARDSQGNVVAVFGPKVADYLKQAYAAHEQAVPPAMMRTSKRKRRRRRAAMMALVGHDAPFGNARLPNVSTPAVPIEGANLGSIWPRSGYDPVD